MNLYQQLFAAYNELLNKTNQLKETQDLRQVISFLGHNKRDIAWYKAANNFIESILDTYPALRYYIVKHRDGRQGIPDSQTMTDYLVIAGMCIITDLYVETHKDS